MGKKIKETPLEYKKKIKEVIDKARSIVVFAVVDGIGLVKIDRYRNNEDSFLINFYIQEYNKLFYEKKIQEFGSEFHKDEGEVSYIG